ncbi:hypothetical protein J437_LFUL000488 [Ladona fulva]|uniref:Uncharacterized protein n=1 Tax=Ladona fulva TaxID=123851 RepID=A0A8K0JTN5_LADFU|nr:hypothetical protein J437_LFUL000488 [Ladona fulva]
MSPLLRLLLIKMADVEPYCDSEEEVFFGPITEKEKLIYKALRVKEMHNGNTEEVPAKYVGGDEGLHALAEAASMLSISGEVEEKDGKVNQGSMGEGSTMELDAVKFLTKHIPEQNGKYEIVNSRAEYMDEMYYSSGVAHNTSFASSVDNNSCSFSNPVCADSPADSFLVLEAQCKMEASTMEGSNNFSLDTVNINIAADPLEKKSGDFIPICELEQLPPLNLSTTELQDVNDRSDFEIKLSDNEEEIEKKERNLKVEEIIKFLADEDIKPDSEEKKEIYVENSDQDTSYQKNPPQNENSKVSEDDDVIIIEINDEEVVDLTDYQSRAEENFSRNTDINIKCELNDMDLVSLDERIKMEVAPKEESMKLNVPLLDKDIKKVIQSYDNMIDNDHGLNERCVKVENESKDEIVKLPSASLEERDYKQICDEVVKIPRLPLEEGDIKEVSHLPVMKQHGKVSSLNSRGALVTQRRLKTPSKVLLRPVHGTGTTSLHKQPLIGETKKHHGTAAPLASPLPARNATSSARTPLKGMGSTTGSNFKTPNSKANLMAASKIPQALHHVTPSPRKNKYADIMSPVAQYIHGNASLLVTNKNVPTLKSTPRREPINNKTVASDQADSVDRGAENIDVNNISSAPLPSNINYKSAVPVKIFSPSPKKCQGNGPVGSVSKHLGRIKITSLQSGMVHMPLGMQCRESLIPDGEVSVLLTKEMNAEHISTL